jgi:hypothetical protein
MVSVCVNEDRTAHDVLVFGLCSACLWMSLTCGMQCLLSVIARCFFGGDLACKFEAFFHVSAIVTQFFMDTAIAMRVYVEVVHGKHMSVRQAVWTVIVIWVVCIGVTLLCSIYSPIYIMTAGTYCFFGFGSAAIAYWLVPALGLALGAMAFYFYKTYRTFRQSQETLITMRNRPIEKVKPPRHRQRPNTDTSSSVAPVASPIAIPVAAKAAFEQFEVSNDGPIVSIEIEAPPTAEYEGDAFADEATKAEGQLFWVILRASILVAGLFVGWAFAAVTAIYELSKGESSEWLVTGVGVGGVLHSVWVPLTHAYFTAFNRAFMIRLFCCCLVRLKCAKDLVKRAKKQMRPKRFGYEHTIISKPPIKQSNANPLKSKRQLPTDATSCNAPTKATNLVIPWLTTALNVPNNSTPTNTSTQSSTATGSSSSPTAIAETNLTPSPLHITLPSSTPILIPVH